jgi:hypothetical protein
MRAVLADALFCYHTQNRSLVREAAAWFSSEDDRWPFAFVNVCRALGLDPASVRRALRQGSNRAAPGAPKKIRQRF